ncbi:unnamed protein product [Strongylus vulgaris]|uniref:Ground-like domain-containing protein n=1 Tax=Strongylus vulgaris TaxID=40348 RepID=A0A3P7L469_STRVU|nr:unnamed protein product [Strongylus vulgaris]
MFRTDLRAPAHARPALVQFILRVHPCRGVPNRSVNVPENGVYIVDSGLETHKHKIWAREKRNVLNEVVKVDAKCNSEELRSIIIESIDRVTSMSKRRIQIEAEKRLGGRYNVICARGDFSYITNTEEFCQQTVGDVTCYAFKQLSEVMRARLA